MLRGYLGDRNESLYQCMTWRPSISSKDLSLLNNDNSPPGACPEPGKVVRIDLVEDD